MPAGVIPAGGTPEQKTEGGRLYVCRLRFFTGAGVGLCGFPSAAVTGSLERALFRALAFGPLGVHFSLMPQQRNGGFEVFQ